MPLHPRKLIKKELSKAEEFLVRNQRVGRIRLVERAGLKLKNLMTNKAPWKKEWCRRPECTPCPTTPGSCRAVNVV